MRGGILLIYEGTSGGCCGDVHVGDVYRIWDDVGLHNEACLFNRSLRLWYRGFFKWKYGFRGLTSHWMGERGRM